MIIFSPVCGASLADELSMIEGPKRKMLPVQDSCEVDSLPEDFGKLRSNKMPQKPKIPRSCNGNIRAGLSGWQARVGKHFPRFQVPSQLA